MLVVFVAPFFHENSVRLLETLATLEGVRAAVVSHDPEELLAPELRRRLVGHWRVEDVQDAEQLAWAAAGLSRHLGRIHRLMSATEQIQVPVAAARERLGVEGMGVEAVQNFRDKSRMKQRFHAHGIPCARYRRVTSQDDAWAFLCEVGFPVVVKPVDSAATQSTYRVENSQALRNLLRASAPSEERPLQIEEFVQGEEHSFETFSLDGVHLWHSFTRYLPTPLDVVRNPWIQWRIILPREADSPLFDDIHQVGPRALDALGARTCLTHMEWFRRGNGALAISEVAARPPGPQICLLTNRAHDMDLDREWMNLMIFHRFNPPPARKYAAGVAFLRGLGGGRVKQVHGLDDVLRDLGDLVTDLKRPAPGQGAGHSYEGEGWVAVRHPSTRVVEEALEQIVGRVRVEMVY
ncbi:MAG: ATP-grasp domain-containing protein [Candidatus Eremiobacterota bacterium]